MKRPETTLSGFRNFQRKYKVKINMAKLSPLILLLAITACTIWTQEDAMRIFVVHKDYSVANKQNIEGYLNPRSAVVSTGSQEVKPGVMEYSFEE
jgi:hypothetical protein